MTYSAKILIAALLLVSSTQAGIKALALPLSNVLAQANPGFSVPKQVPAGTRLRIQASPNLGIATQFLKDRFEAAYPNTAVEVSVAVSQDALAALEAGKVDLAAIGRPLTEAEKRQELVTVPLKREKIAIIIGPENPFRGTLTFDQFAAIFRGEITDWSQVGGEAGPIRFVDRPDTSDTRRSLSQYEVFRKAPFATGTTADPVSEDDTSAVIRALGKDGISYAIAADVLNQPGVTIVPMHKILPDDPHYPYSQPRYFVYKGTVGTAAAAFLGYATSPSATEALATLDPTKAAAIAANLKAAPPSAVSPAPIPSPVPVPGPNPEARGRLAWWWLLPLAGAGALGAAAWAARRKSGTAVAPLESPLPDATLPAAPPAGGGAALDIDATANPEDITVAEATPELAVQPPDVNLPPAALGAAGAAASLVSSESQATPEPEAPPEPAAQAAALGALGVAGLAAGAAASLASTEDQSAIEAAKFNVVGHPVDR
ncbi:MAG: substrate-binding domain-containing protein, partial [Nodosilinea sp.]